MKRPITTAALIVLALASGQVLALGFGRVVSDTVLGQPLSFTVPVHVEPGERFGEDCVRTVVFFGEGQLPPNQVRTLVERGASETEWRVRVTTTGPVNEPVVDVSLDAGCGRPFSRRFTVFADPPTVPWSAQLAQADVASQSPQASPSAAVTPAPVAGPTPSRSARPVVRKGPTVALASSVAAGKAASKRRGPVAAPAATQTSPTAAAASRLQPVDTGARLELSAGFGGPRLRMDIDDPEIPAQDAAAQAALAQQVEGDTQQLESLQRNIATLRHESQAGRSRTAQLQAALEQAESRSEWLPWLAGLFGITLAAALFLAWRLRQQSRLAHSRWYEESALLAASAREPESARAEVEPAPVAPVARPLAAVQPVEARAAFAEAEGAVVQDVAVSPPMHAGQDAETAPMAEPSLPAAPVAALPPQDSSVEELLDIEQQADFFVALGQEDAAVDLLTAHIRGTGVQSPLPYAKLLEIHRRLDDAESYEKVRERFLRRFGVEAPEWSVGPTSGRALEDYPEAVTRLQIVWKAPADAMVLLQSLLFRRDESDELFDLPAYRDMLVLYSISRDLVQHAPQPLPELVDVFLPIGDVAGAAAAADSVRAGRDDVEGRDATVAPTSYEMPEFHPGGRASEFGEVHATLEFSPLDFDVTEPGEAPAGAGPREADAPSGARTRH